MILRSLILALCLLAPIAARGDDRPPLAPKDWERCRCPQCPICGTPVYQKPCPRCGFINSNENLLAFRAWRDRRVEIRGEDMIAAVPNRPLRLVYWIDEDRERGVDLPARFAIIYLSDDGVDWRPYRVHP